MYSLIRDLLQWNVAGIPAYHQVTEWEFDPDISQKRREQFYEVKCFICLLFDLLKIREFSSFTAFVPQNILSDSGKELMAIIDNADTKIM